MRTVYVILRHNWENTDVLEVVGDVELANRIADRHRRNPDRLRNDSISIEPRRLILEDTTEALVADATDRLRRRLSQIAGKP